MTLTYPPPLTVDAYPTLAAPLEGPSVRLLPLQPEHAPGLHQAFREADLWRWQGSQPQTLEETHNWVREALDLAQRRLQAPFVIQTSDGQLAGTTRYLELNWHDAGCEIGWTMVFHPFRRTHVNTEAKWLLLSRAFDELGMGRVQLKTDRLNARSRAAITRLGAQFEGIMRCARRRANGTLRDNAMFSITFEEWPEVRPNLMARLGLGG